ncbi:Splicing factor, arginine/serine-rich 10 [Anas platyrhynchos]|uniref:Transformer-2 protein homolog beta n=1 Tax=Anas platyrhynchos TaxID=8839 RepID=R0L502_ANAPL|nr:Splicing factor, arginine/serine-rich 10 [Anas platyrhynchos]
MQISDCKQQTTLGRNIPVSRSRRSSRRHYTRSRSRSRSHRRSRSRSYSRDYRRRHSHSHSPMSTRRRHIGNRANPDPNCCLGVFGLSLYTTERDLREVFSKYGPIADVSIVYDQQSRRSRGFAFVYFENVEDAKEVEEVVVAAEEDGELFKTGISFTALLSEGFHMANFQEVAPEERIHDQKLFPAEHKTWLYELLCWHSVSKRSATKAIAAHRHLRMTREQRRRERQAGFGAVRPAENPGNPIAALHPAKDSWHRGTALLSKDTCPLPPGQRRSRTLF